MTLQEIQAKVNLYIKTNGNREITGAQSNKVLTDLIDYISVISSLNPFIVDKEYSSEKPDYVTFDNNVWKFINTDPQTGVIPGTDPDTWEISSIGTMAHSHDNKALLDVLTAIASQLSAEDAVTNQTVGNINNSEIVTPRILRYFWDKITSTISFGHIIKNITSTLSTRKNLSFLSSLFSVADNPANDSTDIDIGVANATEVQAGVISNKVIVPSILSGWWTWIKTQAESLDGIWTFINSIKITTLPAWNGTYVVGYNTDGKLAKQLTSMAQFIEVTFSYPGSGDNLTLEANWSNNEFPLCALTAGNRYTVVSELGCSYDVDIRQTAGARRVIIDPWIKNEAGYSSGQTLAAALTTESNWVAGVYYYNASKGDLGQKYRSNDYIYECINGSSHTWIRNRAPSGFITLTIDYYPIAEQYYDKGTAYTFTLLAKSLFTIMVLKNLDTTGGNVTLSIGGVTIGTCTLSTTINKSNFVTFSGWGETTLTDAAQTVTLTISTAARVDIYAVSQKYKP